MPPGVHMAKKTKIVTAELIEMPEKGKRPLDEKPARLGAVGGKRGTSSIGILSAKFAAVMDWKAIGRNHYGWR